MLPFEQDEKLFRAVRKAPNLWRKDGRLSSAAFKTRSNETGTSVFRQDGRTLEESIQKISENLEGAIVSVTYKQCDDSDIKVTETNAKTYHCELTNAKAVNGMTTGLTSFQCQNLADYAIIEKDA